MAGINLLVINQFTSTPKYSSGAGELFYYLGPFFKKEGINVRVVSGGHNHLFVINPPTPRLFNEEQVDGALFTWVKLRQYKKSSFIGRFLSWIEFLLKLFFLRHKDRPDVVLVSLMSLFPIIYAFWLKIRFGVKVVLEVRDIWPLTPMEFAEKILQLKSISSFERTNLGGKGRKFVLSSQTYEVISRDYIKIIQTLFKYED